MTDPRDIYTADLTGAVWMTACGGNSDENGDEETCIAFARIPGGMAIRDTKAPDAGTLRFRESEIEAFALRYLAERGLHL